MRVLGGSHHPTWSNAECGLHPTAAAFWEQRPQRLCPLILWPPHLAAVQPERWYCSAAGHSLRRKIGGVGHLQQLLLQLLLMQLLQQLWDRWWCPLLARWPEHMWLCRG